MLLFQTDGPQVFVNRHKGNSIISHTREKTKKNIIFPTGSSLLHLTNPEIKKKWKAIFSLSMRM